MENIKPYVFISKKTRVINIRIKPKNNLSRIPPQRAIKNIFSDLFTLNFSRRNPIIKFRIGISAPIRIDR
jgi:hypothetical protein